MLLNHDEWLRQLLLQRFDELSKEVEHLPQIVGLRMDLYKKQIRVKQIIEESDNGDLIDLLDMVTLLEVMEKEWMYLKGVQDGIKLVTFQQSL
ncbi:hypothetical protein OB236_10055 [Paenibacillus sp. WQ 127069]|uniref:Uncharacterized protein n=1 Tax=Paenibacillus baimaensis TaxID=2982185 RepID=A0ABT2UEB9_9BACL|nr:hypothetical protein [Paenibacillus sp. WQ 127069]MCU6792471.1 hypothetical protein [Paenibacillus sp. WQ 127069]